MRPTTPESLAGVPLRILVAEDNEFNRDLLEHMLAGRGLAATMVVDGREALALVEREGSSTCCSWTSTCRNWTASRSSQRSGSGSERRAATCPSSP